MWMIDVAIGLGIALAVVALYLSTCIRVLNEYSAGSNGADFRHNALPSVGLGRGRGAR